MGTVVMLDIVRCSECNIPLTWANSMLCLNHGNLYLCDECAEKGEAKK